MPTFTNELEVRRHNVRIATPKWWQCYQIAAGFLLKTAKGPDDDKEIDRLHGGAGLVEEALSPLLDWAEGVVPPQQWHNTPIFLLATAGLRKLPEEHQHAILDSVRHALGASVFKSARLSCTSVHFCIKARCT